MLYIFQITIYTAILFVIYLLLLKDRLAHIWNRAYLLLCAALPLVIPLVRIPSFQKASPVISKSAAILLQQVSVITAGSKRVSDELNWSHVFTIFYVMVSLVILAWTLFQIIRFLKLVTRGNYEKNGWVKVIRESNTDPGSFLNIIFFPGKNIDAVIYKHELAHIRLKHSYDLIFMRCMLIVFWPNIMLYILIKELKMVHEFQADALAAGNKINYINNLLNNSFHTQRFSMANTFFHHPVRRRILMMNKPVMSSKGVFFVAARSFIVTTVLVAGMVYLQSCKQPVQTIPDDTSYQFNFTTDSSIIKVEEDRADLPKPFMPEEKKIIRKQPIKPSGGAALSARVKQDVKNEQTLKIIPNLDKGCFIVSGNTGMLKDEEVNIEISDLHGTIVFQKTVTAANGVLNEDISLSKKISNDMYLLKVHSASYNKALHIAVFR